MRYFAEIDSGNNVIRTVVATDLAWLQLHLPNPATTWIETCDPYNPSNNDPSQALRKNYAGSGFKYDSGIDAFIVPKPSAMTSWVLDVTTAKYVPPITKPSPPTKDTGQKYLWNEKIANWELVPVDVTSIDPVTGVSK